MKRPANQNKRERVVKQWMAQRITAALLIPFGFWCGGSFLSLNQLPFEKGVLWFSSPWNTAGWIVFMVLMFYHGSLGMQVVWEDYISDERTCRRCILGTNWISLFFCGVAILSLVRICFFYDTSL